MSRTKAGAGRETLGWLLLLPAALALACGTKNIKKPAPEPPIDEEADAEAPKPTVKLDSAPFTPMSFDSSAADTPQGDAGDASSSGDGATTGEAGGDALLECIPACPPGQICNDGQCESTCAPGLAVCQTGCADVFTDPKNCGRCDGVCAPSEFCSMGMCVTSCGQGETRCGQSCVNLATDRRNCGVCGNACAGAESCVGGVCRCTGGNLICAGVCQSVSNNRSHCGSCENRCLGQLVCNDRTCGCPRGRVRCPNKPLECVVNLYDCCPGSQIWCDNRCVAPSTDNDHCGRCDRSCPGAQRCSNGNCGCPSTQPKACPGNLCLPAGQCCANEIKCADGTCVANTTCCAGQRRCSNGSCIASTACCSDERMCGTKCISNATNSCCPTDANPCGTDGTRMCNPTTNRCVCVFSCPGPGNRCAADMAGCCAAGQTVCGSMCCDANEMCVSNQCKAPAPPPPPDASPGN